MITLCGFTLSNYYNKVKLALLEKGIPFEEEVAKPRTMSEDQLVCSPLGKIPFIRTPHGPLCESQVIMDYLEAAYPAQPLLPADPYASAKLRELITFTELHLELVARELYGQAFFGGQCSEATQERVRKQLGKNIPAFKRLARFGPYVGGEHFSLADCAAWASLPLVGLATKAVLGEDLLLAHGVDWKSYAKLINQRPTAQRVIAERDADQALALAHMSQRPPQAG